MKAQLTLASHSPPQKIVDKGVIFVLAHSCLHVILHLLMASMDCKVVVNHADYTVGALPWIFSLIDQITDLVAFPIIADTKNATFSC